jgi:N-(2-amino-2-carboxyethyl)-L-glutamate synthase
MTNGLKAALDKGVAAVIGKTPLVRLSKVLDAPFNLYGKLEGLNPGGSVKDRPALEILRDGIASGTIDERTVIIEATSGNMGVALAQMCKYLGLRFICVTDAKVTPQNLRILRAYGAEVEIITEPDRATRELLQARINRAKQIAESIKNSFWVNQYANISNAEAHYRTMEEIVSCLNGQVDFLFCAGSSCGTLKGCAEYARKIKADKIKIWAVDAVGSVIFGGPSGKRLIPGHGSGIRPALYDETLANRCVRVSDRDSVLGCRLLLEREGLLLGGSSGAALMGVLHSKDEIPPGSNCVAIFPDRGERYLDSIFDDTWVETHWPGVLKELQECSGLASAVATGNLLPGGCPVSAADVLTN